MKKILDFSFPFITCWSYQAALLGILQTQETCYDWIFSNYIQLFTPKNLSCGGRHYAVDFFHSTGGDWQYFEHKTNPWIDYYKLPRALIAHYPTPHTFLMEQILSERYVYIPLDASYIPAHSLNHFHTVLIYGFDDSEQVFFCADNCQRGKYALFTSTFAQIDSAILSTTNHNALCNRSDDYDPTLFHLRSTAEMRHTIYYDCCTLDSNKILTDLNNYISGQAPTSDISHQYMYGADCYYTIKSLYESLYQDNCRIDLRPISCLIDHKRMMDKRIHYFKSHGLLNPSFSSYTSVKSMLENLRFCMLKDIYSGEKRTSTLQCLTKGLETCRQLEITSLSAVSSALQE